MRKLLSVFITILFLANGNPVFSASSTNELPECIIITHCVKVNWDVLDVDQAFTKAVELISETPRTLIIEKSDSYLHAEATTKWMRYVDDLEVKALIDEGALQVRSESRVGIGDNGVNKKRIDELATRMNIKTRS